MLRGRQAGLTMVEMMVVLVLIALLMVATYPLLGNVLDVMVSKGAAEQVASAVRDARQRAITAGENRCIQFVGSPPYTVYEIRVVQVAMSTLTCDGTLQATEQIGNEAVVVTGSTLTLIFDPVGRRLLSDGTVATTDATITVQTESLSCPGTITVSPFGGVRAQKC